MSFDGRMLRLLYAHELRSLLRDRRALFFSIVLPLLMAPIYFYANHYTSEQRESTLARTTYHYAIAGSEAEHARELVVRGLDAALEEGRELPLLEEEESETPSLDLEESRLHALLIAEVETMRVEFRADSDASRAGAELLRGLVREGQRAWRADLLKASGFPVSPAAVLPLRETNAASAARTEGAGLGRWLGAILVLFMVSGASIAAADTLAGEKERGTLETLLTTSAGRSEIVGAKLLVVLTVGLAIAACSVGGALGWILLGVGGVSGHVASVFTPAALILILVLLAPVAALVSALLLLVSGQAKTYREAQLWHLPVTLGLFVPALSPLLPSVSLRSAIAVVPISGVSVGIRDALLGRFDPPFLAIAWLSTAGAALWVLRRVARSLSPERLVVSDDSAEEPLLGERALFERRVARVFLGLWAAILVLSLGAPWSDVRVTLLVNLVLLFGGATLFCLRRWRLDTREALSLRPVRPLVLLGVLVGAPAAAVVIGGIFRLVGIVLPVPPEALELTARSLLPDEIPLWQLIPMLTILPALFEELAFRGVLLHGMRRRLGPFALIALNGLVFGLFHVSLYRIVPTGVLGATCAALVLVTGSILPAMLWHGVYNGSAIGLALAGLSPFEMGPLEYASASALLAVSAWIVWRGRRRAG